MQIEFRRIAIPLFFALGIVGFLSCKRCVTCKVKDAVGNTIYYAPEKCGTKNEVDRYQTDLLGTYYCQTYTVRDSDGNVIYISPEICGDVLTMRAADSTFYWTFVADSPTVSYTRQPTKVYCVK